MTIPQRRASPRFDVEYPVVVWFDEVSHPGKTVNISLGGLFVQLDGEIPFGDVLGLVGTRVTLELTLPGREEPVELSVRVRWTDTESGLGVQFGKLSRGATLAVEQLIDELEEKAGAAG